MADNPAPLPKYASRWAMPFVGILGWLYYIWDTFVMVVMFTTLIDAWNTTAWLFIGLLIGGIALSLVFWLINGFWFMPHYATRMHSKYDPSSGMPVEMLMEREWRTYPSALREDLKAHNDQEHFQTELFRYLFIIIFIACFLGQRGLQSFQPLPVTPTNNQISDYVVSKLFQLMILATVALSFHRLGETHSDLIWRHLTHEDPFLTGSGVMQQNGNNYKMQSAYMPTSLVNRAKKGFPGEGR